MASTQVITSNNHPLAKASFSSRRKRVFFQTRSTLFLFTGRVSLISKILPEGGILDKRILHPTHPALLAVGDKGFLFSITFGTKKCFGMTKKSETLRAVAS